MKTVVLFSKKDHHKPPYPPMKISDLTLLH